MKIEIENFSDYKNTCSYISKNGKVLASGGDNLIGIWDTGSGKLINSIELNKENEIEILALSNDGSLVFAGKSASKSICDMRIALLKTSDGTLIKETEDILESFESMDVSNDDRKLAVSGTLTNYCYEDTDLPYPDGDDYWVRIFEIPSLKCIHETYLGCNPIESIVFSLKDSLIAIYTEEWLQDIVSVWDYKKNEEKEEYIYGLEQDGEGGYREQEDSSIETSVFHIGFDSKNNLLAFGLRKGIYTLWDVRTGNEIIVVKKIPKNYAFPLLLISNGFTKIGILNKENRMIIQDLNI